MTIKVCGMARGENIRQVAALGPDMMGLIFYASSPRNALGLDPGAVLDLPPGIKRVGVFVDETADTIMEKAETYGLDLVQLHGNESPRFCRELKERGHAVIKAFPVAEADDLRKVTEYEGICEMFIFDTKTPLKGGSGRKFDHSLLAGYHGTTPFLLSGGIGPDDTEILSDPHPACAGLDLNSRFEIAPGMKDTTGLGRFINELRSKRYEQDR